MTRKDALLYGLAGLLVLASVPIYRAILRGPAVDDSPPSPPPSPAVQSVRVSPSGLQCTRGILYRHDAAGAQAVVQGGQLVRCLEPVPTLRR